MNKTMSVDERELAIPGPEAQAGIGVIVPFDMALDRELWRWVPDEVSLYMTRTAFVPVPVTVEMASLISDEAAVHSATRDLLTPEPSVVAYCCSSGSFIDGVVGERALVRAMMDAGAPTSVTSSGALIKALEEVGARRIAVAAPYVDSVTERLHRFLAESDIEVLSSVGLGLLGQIWKVSYRQVAEIVKSADHPDVEAIFISCTNLPTYDVIGPLEVELGKPILTANQITMWAALRMMGQRVVGVGQSLVDGAVSSAA